MGVASALSRWVFEGEFFANLFTRGVEPAFGEKNRGMFWSENFGLVNQALLRMTTSPNSGSVKVILFNAASAFGKPGKYILALCLESVLTRNNQWLLELRRGF